MDPRILRPDGCRELVAEPLQGCERRGADVTVLQDRRRQPCGADRACTALWCIRYYERTTD